MHHRRTPMAGLVIFALAACALLAFWQPAGSGVEIDKAKPRIEGLDVMSFNIRYGTANDGPNSWKYRADMVCDVLRKYEPDVVGVQEALRFQLDVLRQAMPRYGEIGVAREDGKTEGEYSAILYDRQRLEVTDSGTFWLSDTPEVCGSITWGNACTRICTWGRFVDKETGRGFYVYNTHLDHRSQGSREKSVVLLAERIAARKLDEPFIVTGDFNAGETNPAIKYLKGELARRSPVPMVDTFRVIHPGATDVGTFNGFLGRLSGEKIDFVFTTEDVEVLDAEIVYDRVEDRYPSDHFPVRATLRLPKANTAIRPGHAEWPMAWSSYHKVKSLDEDIRDLQTHGVGLISMRAGSVEKAEELLQTARRTGMKYHIHLPEITEHEGLVRQAGLEPVPAVMIGGVYAGKAIDRHLFAFDAAAHRIVIEPPVYNKTFAYTRGSGATGGAKKTEPIAHYFPELGDPLRAEVVVPLKEFDGRQHLKIIEAELREAPADTTLAVDSVTEDMPASSETKNRTLYEVAFDLSGLEGAMLDKVGIAVYWRYGGSGQYWMFGRGNVSAWADSTHEALRSNVRRELEKWEQANGGTFPNDVVLAARLGDECFHISGHLNGPAASYPLWDYSEPSVRAFRAKAGRIEYPRTWGFPEIYGADAYAWWMYTLHEGCAGLCGVARRQTSRRGILLFRNTTRMGVFDLHNDRDGSGQQLLTQNLDIVHYDPYPVGGGGYKSVIPRDMAYGAGLARRYDRLLIPWMQAHTYAPGGLGHVSPEQVDRMAAQQWRHGVDAVIWLGYGDTFPNARPASWRRAAVFHERLDKSPPPKPQPQMAVLRPYTTWALSHRWDGGIRNPADWMLQQLLEVWAVEHGNHYDVFELPPTLSDEGRRTLLADLKDYEMVVSTMPWPDAWIIGEETEGKSLALSEAGRLRDQYQRELKARGWLD